MLGVAVVGGLVLLAGVVWLFAPHDGPRPAQPQTAATDGPANAPPPSPPTLSRRGPMGPPAPPDEAEPPPPPKPLSPLERKVNRAVEKGAAYLKPRLAELLDRPETEGGYRTGLVALAALTLLECGAPADDPLIRKAADAVRADADRLTNPYEASVAVWLLDRLDEPGDRDVVRGLALRLIASQTANGGWSYTVRTLSPQQRYELLRRLQDADDKAADPAADAACLRWRPGDKLKFRADAVDDNSNTQFVVLALWAARRCDVPVGRALALAEARFRASQNADGSWDYRPEVQPTDHPTGRLDSMTCAGLMGLAVGWGVRRNDGKPAAAARDPAIDRAVAFLGRSLGKATPPTPEETARLSKEAAPVRERLEEWLALVHRLQLLESEYLRTTRLSAQRAAAFSELPPEERAKQEAEFQDQAARTQAALEAIANTYNPIVAKAQAIFPTGGMFKGQVVKARAWGDLYYLWSLERMAVAYDWKTLDGVDWYAWGADLLTSAQGDDGGWSDAFPGVPDTCFALLFLKRANVAQSLTKQVKARQLVVESSK
jgi:hypothetical protein